MAFSELQDGSFSEQHISQVPAKQGVYHLFLNGTLVYIGKADSLFRRLSEHREKIQGRQNISPEEMGFKCLTVAPTWTPMALEDALIRHYKSPGVCEWNGNGFGPHDPGRERETTNKHPEGFDSQYPIRENWPCVSIDAGTWSLAKLLRDMKKELPYLLRYDTKHDDYKKLKVDVPGNSLPAVDLLKLVAKK